MPIVTWWLKYKSMSPYDIYPKISADVLNNEVYCRVAPSVIHGVGVVAIQDIQKGTLINIYWNEAHGKRFQISLEEWDLVKPEITDIILASGCITDGEEGYYVIEHPNSHHCFFVNHVDEPNTKEGVAMRDIKTGEEITRYCNGVHKKVIEHFKNQGIIVKNDL